MKPSLVILLFSTIFVLSGAALIVFGFRQMAEARASLQWPVAHGRVIHSEFVQRKEITKATERDRFTYRPEIRYEYEVNGRVWTASRVSFGDAGSSDFALAQEVVARYPVGTAVKVAYRAEDPASACLEPGPHKVTWIMPGAGMLFTLIGVLVFWLFSRR